MGSACSKRADKKDLEELYPQFANINQKRKTTAASLNAYVTTAAAATLNGAFPTTAAADPVENGDVGPGAELRTKVSLNGPLNTAAKPVSRQISATGSATATASRPRTSSSSSTSSQVLLPPPPPLPLQQQQQQQQGGIDWSRLEREAQQDNYRAMKEDFIKNPQQFLVNQLLMSVQFGKNFDRDKEAYRNLKVDTEDDMKDMLSETKQRAIVSDAMYHAILDNVGYKAYTSGNELPNNVLEQLLPTNYHISYEYIESNRREDFQRLANGSMEYTQVDSPYYRVCVEPSSNAGYAKLRCVDDYEKLLPDEDDDGNVTTSKAQEPDVPLLPSPRPVSPHNTITSGDVTALYERLPTPIESKKAYQSAQVALELGEEEDDDDDSPQTGAELLRKIENRLSAQSSPLPSRGSPVRLSPVLPGSRVPPSPPSLDRTEPPVREGRRGVWTSNNLPPAINEDQQGRDKARSTPRFGTQRNGGTAAAGTEDDKHRKSADGSQSTKSNSSPYSLEDDGYGYATKSAKDLEEVLLKRFGFGSGDGTSKHNFLPSRCFKKIEVPLGVDMTEDDPYQIDSEMETHTFLSSRYFMANFAVKFYELARLLDKGSLTGGAKYLSPRIICHEERASEGAYAKEARLDFIPTIEVGFWPDEGIEWYLRSRCKIRDRRTDFLYQWPPTEIVSQAQQIGCNLVPMSFYEAKKDKRLSGSSTSQMRKDSSIEWQFQFPKMESLIQKHLNQPKLRCLWFVMLLHRTFLVRSNSLTDEHLRYLFYWMVEKTPAGWQDEQLGLKLYDFLKEMKGHLMKEKLPHYFMSKRNMLAEMAKHKIRWAHEKLHRLQENLVPHLLIAVKRLHGDKHFYPLPDVDRLYTVLTSESALAMINPDLLLATGGQAKVGNNAFERQRLLNQKRKSQDPSQQRMHALHKKLQAKNAELHSLHSRSNSTASSAASGLDPDPDESAYLAMQIGPGFFHGDPSRGRLVIEFFIAHFIALAKKCNEFRSYGQALMFYLQAENLFQLLKDLKFHGSAAHMDLRAELEHLRQVSRGSSRDYWNVNWAAASDEGVAAGAGAAGGYYGVGLAGHRLNRKEQSAPLPELPPELPEPAEEVETTVFTTSAEVY